MTSDEQLNDVLYAAPLESFVAERTRLSAELRTAGDRAGAARIAKAAKPTVSAWAVNQLARRERVAMQRLIDAGARLRDAQLSGAGREEFAAASAAQREALGELRRAAERILTEGGHGAAPAVLERVARNLRAAGATEELARQIQAGCLVSDLEAETFEGFAALASGPLPAPERVDRSAALPRGDHRGRVWEPSKGPHLDDARAAARARAEAKAEEQRRSRERVDREREVARARRVVEETGVRASRAREAATRARRAADEAEAEATAAEAAAADARRALAEAERALASSAERAV